MRRTFFPRTDTLSSYVYLLDRYASFMNTVRGATPVVSLALSQRNMPRIGNAVYHIQPEGITLHYHATEHSTGDRKVRLDYHGSRQGIRDLRKRINIAASTF